jgi:hypothetical protein
MKELQIEVFMLKRAYGQDIDPETGGARPARVYLAGKKELMGMSLARIFIAGKFAEEFDLSRHAEGKPPEAKVIQPVRENKRNR